MTQVPTQPIWWHPEQTQNISSYGIMGREADFGNISGVVRHDQRPVNLSVPYFPSSVDIVPKTNLYTLVKGPEIILQSLDWSDVLVKSLPLLLATLVGAIAAPLIKDIISRRKGTQVPAPRVESVPTHSTSVVFEK